jgi:hypothetical protein
MEFDAPEGGGGVESWDEIYIVDGANSHRRDAAFVVCCLVCDGVVELAYVLVKVGMQVQVAICSGRNRRMATWAGEGWCRTLISSSLMPEGRYPCSPSFNVGRVMEASVRRLGMYLRCVLWSLRILFYLTCDGYVSARDVFFSALSVSRPMVPVVVPAIILHGCWRR